MSRLEASAYLIALGCLPGVGLKTVVNAARSFEDFEALASAPTPELEAAVGKRSARALREGIAADWPSAWSKGQRTVEQHMARSITLIPITDPGYPTLLRLIPDAPPVLYLQGREASLQTARMVAIVGTREATPLGLSVARRVAQRFAEAGYVIVSGLAKGIDTAAHEGGLAGGSTVAVLGTSLDKIYPAENKNLAAQIAETGALVSEYPIGYASHVQSFVERDRIQAGLSLAVIPVQTGLQGGTQQTIKFAETQHRLLLCPRPLRSEEQSPAYDGIHQLIESHRARSFDADDYADLWKLLDALEHELVGEAERLGGPTGFSPGRSTAKGGRHKKPDSQAGDDLLLFGASDTYSDQPLSSQLTPFGSPPIPVQGSRAVDLSDLLTAVEAVIDELAPHLDDRGLDTLLEGLRVGWKARSHAEHGRKDE